VRKELRRWLRRLHDTVQVTSVFVTHDQDEAMEVADRIVVMNQGRIEQAGTREELLARPATPFVRDFLRDDDESPAWRAAHNSWSAPAGSSSARRSSALVSGGAKPAMKS
jgi:ABC-type sulfate/molybdate transport systems ATPase subunit